MQEKSQDNDYWRDRFRQMEEAQNRASIEQAQLMAEQYERAERKIAGKINAWYQRFANNNEITMAEAKRLLNSGELKELRWDVQEYIRYGEENSISQAWAKELENASARIHIRRLEALNLQVQQEIEALYGNCIDSIDNHIRKTYSRDFYHTAFEIHKGIGVGSRLTGLDERLLDKIVSKPWAIDGKNFSERLWGNKTRLVNELHNSLSTMCITGQSPQRVIDDLCNKMKSSRKNTTRLIMTESAVFANQARKDCMKELEVEEYEVIETLDGITCEFCQKMDKKHFKLSDFRVGVTAPVFHPNCRGCTCPYFDDEFTRMEERAARRWDGKTYYVPGDMTYKEWEKSFVKGDMDRLTPVGKDGTLKLEGCKTIEDVEALFRQKDWFIHGNGKLKGWRSDEGLSLKGCDLQCAKGIYKAYEQLFDRFPQMKNKLAAVSTATLPHNVYAQCTVGFGNGMVQVNSMLFNDIDKLTKKYHSDVKQGFHTAGTSVFSIITHELGHSLDDYLTNILKLAGETQKGKRRYVSSMLRPKVMTKCNLTVQKKDIANYVSGYAAKDAKEFFAECFAEYMCSDNPRTVAAEFGKQLEEIMRGVK